MHRRTFVLTPLVFLLGRAVAAPSVPDSALGLIRRLDAIRTDNDISALGLAVVDSRSDGDSFNFSTALGTYSHDTDEPVSADTVFRLGSVTKGFTALTLLRLAQRGIIAPDAPLSRYLDAALWRNPWRDSSPVTLAQLLEHTAGFTDMSRAEWDSAEHLPLGRALERFAPVRAVRWRPGEWYSYTNVGAGLAGRAMELASGHTYEHLVDSELLTPLGMRDSGFDAGPVRVTGYDRDGVTPIPYWHTIYRPFGGLNASVNDMAHYVRLHLNCGRTDARTLFRSGTLARVECPVTSAAARAGLKFGYGLGNYAWLRDGVLFHGHGGDADGYLSRFAYSHELGKGYFLVVNAFNSRALGLMRRAVERFLANGFEGKIVPEPLTLTTAEHDWLSGDYRVATRRFGWDTARSESRRVEVRNGRIHYASGSRRIELLGVAEGEAHVLLRRAHHNRATAIAFRTTTGAVRLVDDDRNLQRIDPA